MPLSLPLPLLRHALTWLDPDLRECCRLGAVCRAWREWVWAGSLLRRCMISEADVLLLTTAGEHAKLRLPHKLHELHVHGDIWDWPDAAFAQLGQLQSLTLRGRTMVSAAAFRHLTNLISLHITCLQILRLPS